MVKKIIVGILAFIVALVVGFAIFSENLRTLIKKEIDNKVKVSLTCQPGLFNDLNLNLQPSNGFSNEAINCSDNKITLSTSLKDKDSLEYFSVKVKNESNSSILFDKNNLNYKESCLSSGKELLVNDCNAQISLVSYYYNGKEYLEQIPILGKDEEAYLIFKVFWEDNNSNNNNWNYNTEFELNFDKK